MKASVLPSFEMIGRAACLPTMSVTKPKRRRVGIRYSSWPTSNIFGAVGSNIKPADGKNLFVGIFVVALKIEQMSHISVQQMKSGSVVCLAHPVLAVGPVFTAEFMNNHITKLVTISFPFELNEKGRACIPVIDEQAIGRKDRLLRAYLGTKARAAHISNALTNSHVTQGIVPKLAPGNRPIGHGVPLTPRTQ